jgi:hypothetical protein
MLWAEKVPSLRIKDLAKKGVDASGMRWVKMGNRGE